MRVKLCSSTLKLATPTCRLMNGGPLPPASRASVIPDVARSTSVIERSVTSCMSSTLVQLRTNKVNKLVISRTRFFGWNLTTDLKSDGQKELKNGVFVLFPRGFGRAKFLSKIFRKLGSTNRQISVPKTRQPQQPGLLGSSRHRWPS